jgi:hypothetical protein
LTTYRDVNKLSTPDDIILIVGVRRIGNGLHVLEEHNLGFPEKSSHDLERLELMGVAD